jgi:Ca-activated chloride channel family protein
VKPEDRQVKSAENTFHSNVDLVLVPATVVDAMNRPITDLSVKDFALFEDSAPQKLRYFVTEDAPISIGLILDVSKSMSDKIETERIAVDEFFKNANPQDDYFVITLSDRPRLIADTTQSIEEIQNKLSMIDPNDNTSLVDAIYVGVLKLRSARYSRRALLIISDGGDNHSYYSAKATRHLIEESDVLAYSIGIFDNMPVPVFKTIEEKLGRHLLNELTEVSGGHTFAADDRNKVPEMAAAISRQLRQQYVMGYKSSNSLRDGKWRKIKLQVTTTEGTPPLRAYYRRGYISPSK